MIKSLLKRIFEKPQEEQIPQEASPPPERPKMILYEKQYIMMALLSGDLPEFLQVLFAEAMEQCKIYEENDLTPLIGYCNNPITVIVTSVERAEGKFIQ